MQRKMEEYSRLFDPMAVDKQWLGSHGVSEEKKLELRLGPPGDFLHCKNTSNSLGAKRVHQDTVEEKTGERNWLSDSNRNQCPKFSCYDKTGSLHSTFQRETWKELEQTNTLYFQYPLITQNSHFMEEDASVPSSSRVEGLQCPDSSSPGASATARTVVANGEHKRSSENGSLKPSSIALAPIIGWPPIRSSRKNLASSSLSKLASKSTDKSPKDESGLRLENHKTDMFIKVNMEGVPIGRKVNLNAYDSYEKLSVAIDELFRGLLAAQRDSPAAGNEDKTDEMKESASSAAGSGEYTLVYEDNEGDRILAGDVPWHMFVSTAKRLRVLKNSELSILRVSTSEQEKTPLDSAAEESGG